MGRPEIFLTPPGQTNRGRSWLILAMACQTVEHQLTQPPQLHERSVF
jgi:hypothetical protein